MIFNNQLFVVIGIFLIQVCSNVAMSPFAGGVDLVLFGSNSHSKAGNRRVGSNIRPTRLMTKETHPMLASIYGTAQNARVLSGQKPLSAPSKEAYGKSALEKTKYNQKSKSLNSYEELCNLCSRANDLDCIMRHCFNTEPTNVKLNTADLLSEKNDNLTPNKPRTKLTDFQVGKFALGSGLGSRLAEAIQQENIKPQQRQQQQQQKQLDSAIQQQRDRVMWHYLVQRQPQQDQLLHQEQQ